MRERLLKDEVELLRGEKAGDMGGGSVAQSKSSGAGRASSNSAKRNSGDVRETAPLLCNRSLSVPVS